MSCLGVSGWRPTNYPGDWVTIGSEQEMPNIVIMEYMKAYKKVELQILCFFIAKIMFLEKVNCCVIVKS